MAGPLRPDQFPSGIDEGVAGEIAALTEKSTPVSADILMIEDSASGNVKKKIQIGKLAGTVLVESEPGDIVTSKELDQDDPSGFTSGSWVTVQDSGGDWKVDFTTTEGERPLVTGHVSVSMITAVSGWSFGIGVDGSDPIEEAVLIWERSTASGANSPIQLSYRLPALSAGAHYIVFKAIRRTGTGDLLIHGVSGSSNAGSVLQVSQYRGGFVRPDNVPVFTRDSTDTSLINANASIGADSSMAIALNDGIRRTATLPITCDIDTTGVGGRDASESSPAAGDLYHIHAVPSDTDASEIKLVMSKDAVPGTSGPPNHSVYLYLWTIRVDTIGPVVIEEFTQAGEWYRPINKNDTDYSIDAVAGTPSTSGSWVDKTTALRALIPESADEVEIEGWLSIGAAAADQYIFIAGEASPSWTPVIANPPYSTRFLVVSDGASRIAQQTRNIAVPTREFAIWYQNGGTITSTVHLGGYRNAMYPGSRVIQSPVIVSGGGGIETLDTPPSNPHVANDEFDGDSVSGSWTANFTVSSTPPGPQSSFTTGDQRVLVRNSKLIMQPVMDATLRGYHKAITVDTNFLAMAKILIPDRDGSPGTIAQNEISCGLELTQTSGGAPDFDNAIWIQGNSAQVANTPSRYLVYKTVGGVPTQLDIGPTTIALGAIPTYYSILKLGTTYNFWVHNGSGLRTWIGAFSEGGLALDRVLIWAYAANHSLGSAVPNPIVEYDWVRFETLSGDVMPELWR